jgi:triacylglycerol esterase/lipase EstA (alpha/beta hydrolase family)
MRRASVRWLATAIILVVAVAVVATVALAGHGSPRHPVEAGPSTTTSPPRTDPTNAVGTKRASPPASATKALPPRPPDDRPGPVILVPGFGGDVAMLDSLAARLRHADRRVIVLQLPDAGTGDLRGQESVLADRVDTELARGADSVDLVGYSAGGIVVALFAASHPSQVRRIVTLGSPLHGTRLAGLAADLLPSACTPACQQMAPGSPLIASLESASPDVTGVPWLSVWTTHDEIVTPPSSARFEGARNIELQAVCADDAATHISLPSDPLAIGLTVRALSTGLPLPTPSPAGCTPLRALGG